jgi:hypothetical protein
VIWATPTDRRPLVPEANPTTIGATLLSVSLLLTTSCVQSQSDQDKAVETQPTSKALISDQALGGGATGFFWLPPIVERVRTEGVLDRTLSPQVDIHEIDSNGRVLQPLATYTTTTGPGSERIRITGNHYQVDWKTKSFNLKRRHLYRIRVTLRGQELGVADMRVAGSRGGHDDDHDRCEIRTEGR